MSKTSSNSVAPSTHPAFDLVRQQFIPALSTTVFEYRHKKTNAVHYHLGNQNPEKVFLVAFRTQPMDSKGTAHILEHPALCGSKKYPVRDPFFSMIRRSLNTFMNAFTAADWTAYPFATQNDKDFNNLLSVYLDAAFHANLNPLDFAQEGIRIELENDRPMYKGIVFNEMKGAMSAATDQLYHKLAHHLYPKTTYHYNSGGDPNDIPDLSYEQLKAFYQSHYHPSNAVLMSFGDFDVTEFHAQVESQALQDFEHGNTIHSVPEQRLSQPIQVVESYAVDEDDLSEKTYHVMAWLLPEMTNIKLRLAMRLVEGILLENSASPLRQYLETSGLGQSTGPMLGVDDSNFEMTFYCGIQGSEADRAEQFEQGTLEILKNVASKPIDPSQIEAILHQIELHQREIGGDGTPYGLSLILNGLGAAIHHGDPVAVWDVDQALSQIREDLQDPMWLSNLIQTYLIDNPHRVRMTLIPDQNISAQEQAAEQARLDQINEKLTDADRAQLIEQAEALKQRQATEDDLSLLPKVGLEDIPADLKHIEPINTTIQLANRETPVKLYHAGTNGLFYQQVLIELPDDVVQSPYLGILALLMGEVGAGDDDYLTLQQRQTEISGGVGMGVSLRSQVDDANEISALLTLTTKALNRNPDAMQLLQHAFCNIRLDEKSRILELLQQRKARWQARLSNAGHAYAMQTASRNMSAYAKRDYHVTGLPALQWLSKLIDDIRDNDVSYTQFIEQIQSLQQRILNQPKQFLLVCEKEFSDELLHKLADVWSKNAVDTETAPLAVPSFETNNQDQAWLIQSNVQFCASVYPAVAIDHPDAAVMTILGPYLRDGFLHQAIREQGGAYGGGAGYDANACAFRFFSYRDPRMSETFADFERSIDWLMNHDAKPHQMYLVDQTPSKSVVAPIARQNDLIDLGFDIQRL